MHEFTGANGRKLIIGELPNAHPFVAPFEGAVFVAVLWDCDGTLGADQRGELATELIRSGCRYIVCGGIGCELWHDDADLAWVTLNLQAGQTADIPFVMTTGHENESEDDVVFFALNCTSFDEHDFKQFLVLVIGCDPNCLDRIQQVVEDQLIVG